MRKGENNALLIYDWRLYFFRLDILFQFLADENRFNDRRKDLVEKIEDRRKDLVEKIEDRRKDLEAF